MGFCTKCGQARTGDNRFCTTCGTQFPADAADSPDTRPRPASRAGKGASADAPADQAHPATELVSKPASRDAAEEQEYPPTQAVSRNGAPGAADQEYADYPQTQAVGKPAFWDQSAEPDTAATTPRPGQSIPPYSGASPGDAAGYGQAPGYPDQGQASPWSPQSPQYPPAGGQPAPGLYQQPGGYPPAYPRQGGPGAGKRAALIALAAAFILAAGGGAYALVSSLRGHTSSVPPTTALSTSPPAAPPTTASPTETATTTAPPTTPSSAVPADAVGLTSQAAGNAASAQVVDLFNRYFDGINTHNYAEYANTLDTPMRAKNTQSSFGKGYATTQDSNELITALSPTGVLTAVVTFTSHQNPADSVDNHSCNTWQLTLPLTAQGSGYLISSPPPGYAKYADC
jgi:hypothetical protein